MEKLEKLELSDLCEVSGGVSMKQLKCYAEVAGGGIIGGLAGSAAGPAGTALGVVAGGLTAWGASDNC